MDETLVAFAGAECGEDGVLARLAPLHELHGNRRGNVACQLGLQFSELGGVAISDDDPTDEASAEERLQGMHKDRLTREEGGDFIIDDGLHPPCGTRGEEDENVVAGAHAHSPISRRIRSVSAAGSLAFRMGRPTTMKLAPAAAACAGVITRCWSSPAASG